MPSLKPYPAYADTDLPWLPKIPKHWEVQRAKYIFKKITRPVRDEDDVVTAFRDGTVTLRTNRRTEGFTFSIKEIGYQGIRKGDLVIHQMDGFAGAIGVSDSDGKASPIYSVCLPLISVNNYYFAYVLRHMAKSNFILSLAKGIRERSSDFRFDVFKELELPIPSLLEQNAIVNFLDKQCNRIEKLISKKKILIDLLLEKRVALINQIATKGINQSAEMKDSGTKWLGNIPENWQVIRSKYLFKLRNEKALSSDKQLTVSIGRGVISQEEFMSDENRRIAPVLTGMDILKHVEPNDFVISMRSFQGGIEWSRVRGATSSAYVVLIPNEQVYPHYFSYLLKSESYIKAIQSTTNLVRDGQALRYANFCLVDLPIVPLGEQKAIAEYLDKEIARIDSLIKKIYQVIERLQEYRAALISSVVTGKVDVRKGD